MATTSSNSQPQSSAPAKRSALLIEGAAVRVADREPTAADGKSGLFYPYYRGLTGTIAKLYADETATITVDADSLPDEIRVRHQTGTEALRQKWLDGLSDEARNKLSAAEKKFSLRYSLLVGVADLSPADPATAPVPSNPIHSAPAPKPTAPEPAPTARRGQALAAQPSLDMEDLIETPRRSLDDLAADEARYLAERAANKDAKDARP